MYFPSRSAIFSIVIVAALGALSTKNTYDQTRILLAESFKARIEAAEYATAQPGNKKMTTLESPLNPNEKHRIVFGKDLGDRDPETWDRNCGFQTHETFESYVCTGETMAVRMLYKTAP